MTRRSRILATALAALAALTILAAPAHAAPATLWYTGHVQNAGWLQTVHDGADAGTTGRSLRLEAITFTDPVVIARGHVQNLGWLPESGELVGTTGRSLRLEAVQVAARWPGWAVRCQAHVQNLGWLPPVGDGQTCGTTGRSLRLEAVRLWMEPTP